MMKKLLFILFVSLYLNLSAQVQTVNIDWSFGSNPTVATTASNYTNKTIEVGDTVTWIWSANGSSHNVNSTSGETFQSSFSGSLGFTFSHTFTTIGSSNYQCDPHATNMFGTITVVANGTLGINTLEDSLNAISIYPNPVSETLNIQFPSDIKHKLAVEIYNVLGEKIFQKDITKLTSKILISDWNSGVYLMKISSKEYSKSVTKRFVKI